MTLPRILSDLEALHAAASKNYEDIFEFMTARDRWLDAYESAFPAMLRALRAVYAWQASVDAEPEDYPWPISTETARAWEAMDAALAALGEAKEAGR